VISGADDRPEQLTSPLTESLYVSHGWLVAGCQHPGLELLRSQTTVAGHYSGGDRLDCDMQVLPRARAMGPQRHVGLLRPAERFDNAGSVAQNRAEFGCGRIIKVRDGHDVLFRADDQGPEIHRANDVVHHPPTGLMNDASRQDPPPSKKIASETSHHVHVHVRQTQRFSRPGQDDHDARASLEVPCYRQTGLSRL
jgi:hypothetical protein